MYKGRRICVVVPAHNEEAHVAGVIRTMPSFVDHVVVVDDASTDRTAAAAGGTGDPRVEVIRHAVNQGVGGAILTGHKRAVELGADVSAVMAGDGQMDPAHLSKLLDAIVDEGYDYAKGNRFITRGTLRGMPRHRVWGNAFLTIMTKFASGYWHVFDTQNGYTAISRRALEAIPLERVRRDYLFENSLLCELGLCNMSVKDVATPAVYGDETSGIRIGRLSFRALGYLTRAFWHRILVRYIVRDFHPVAILYTFGTVFLAWGIAFGWLVVYWSIGVGEASTGTVMLSVLPLFLGFQMLLTAVTIDINLAAR